MHLKISAKWWPFCPGGDELTMELLFGGAHYSSKMKLSHLLCRSICMVHNKWLTWAAPHLQDELPICGARHQCNKLKYNATFLFQFSKIIPKENTDHTNQIESQQISVTETTQTRLNPNRSPSLKLHKPDWIPTQLCHSLNVQLLNKYSVFLAFSLFWMNSAINICIHHLKSQHQSHSHNVLKMS